MQEEKEVALLERRRERFTNKAAFVASKYLRRMDEMSGRPEALTPFLDVLKKVHVDFEQVVSKDKKIIGTYCMMVPQELIYAAGAENIKLCSGSFTAFSIGDDITPRDACPLVKAVAGMQEIGNLSPYSDCDLMVVPITCDCKKKLALMLSEQTQVHVMQVPSIRQSDELLELYVEELYSMLPVLEQVTGNTITFDSLMRGVDVVGAAQFQMMRFMNLKRQKPVVIRGTHAMAVMNALSYMPIDNWTEAMKKLMMSWKAEGKAVLLLRAKSSQEY